jgi:hypothetical protein
VNQKRHRDADNLFNAALKSKLKTGLGYECSINLYESLAYNSHSSDRNLDAKKCQLRGIHQCPSELKLWYNYACIISSKVEKIFKKASTSKSEIADSELDSVLSSSIFTLLLQCNVRFVSKDILKANEIAARDFKSRISDMLDRLDKNRMKS